MAAGCAKTPPQAVVHGRRDLPRVALTFDACSSRGRGRCDLAVVDFLIRTRTPATLFLGGKWMEDQPAAARRLAEQPFLELGTHGYMHDRPAALSDVALRADLERAIAAHLDLTGCAPALFRAPYADHDDRVTRLAAGLGLTTVEYDVDSGDPDPNFDADRLVRWVGGQVKNGSIIVFHVNGRGWHTAEALPRIVKALRARGFELRTVSDLIGDRQARSQLSLLMPSRAATL